MIVQQQINRPQGPVSWHRSDILTVPHGMFTRLGGVASPPFASLNLSFGVGDSPERVFENRRLIKQCLGLEYLVSANQVHGDQVIIAEDILQDIEFTGFDSLITSQRGVGLLIQQADCQAVLLHDSVQQVIAAVHSGWRGSTLDITGRTVSMMEKQYGVQPADLRAVISPSLGPCCAQFTNYRLELPKSFHSMQVKPGYFDFWEITRNQLIEAGLCGENIETAEICTMCSSDFFSYRRAVQQRNGITGRNGSVISLP
jgi:YfiH family protein